MNQSDYLVGLQGLFCDHRDRREVAEGTETMRKDNEYLIGKGTPASEMGEGLVWLFTHS